MVISLVITDVMRFINMMLKSVTVYQFTYLICQLVLLKILNIFHCLDEKLKMRHIKDETLCNNSQQQFPTITHFMSQKALS